MFLAYYERVIVRPTEAQATVEGELINPEDDTKIGTGLVVSAGVRWTERGPRSRGHVVNAPPIEMGSDIGQLEVGDTVLYNVYAGIPHQDTVILRHTDILAIERVILRHTDILAIERKEADAS